MKCGSDSASKVFCRTIEAESPNRDPFAHLLRLAHWRADSMSGHIAAARSLPAVKRVLRRARLATEIAILGRRSVMSPDAMCKHCELVVKKIGNLSAKSSNKMSKMRKIFDGSAVVSCQR